MNNYLKIETTTGLPIPPGLAMPVARGGVQDLILQFFDSGVAALHPSPTFKLFDPDDLVNELVEVTAWTEHPSEVLYRATLDTLAGALAAVQGGTTLFGQATWNSGGNQSGQFHVDYGIGPAGGGGVTIIIPLGPGKQLVTLRFDGKLVDEQVFGYFKALADGQILGAQIAAQTAPTGADVQIDLVNASNTEQSKIITLTAGTKQQETIYGTPLAFSENDVFKAKVKQVGSTNPGRWVTLNLITQYTE